MWLRERRNELGLSLAEMAQRLTDAGISRTGAAIGTWEMNGHVPLLSKPDQAKALADVLEMTLSDMLLSAGFDLDLVVRGQPVPADFVIFIEQYDRLTRREQHTVSQMLEFMAEKLIDLRDDDDS